MLKSILELAFDLMAEHGCVRKYYFSVRAGYSMKIAIISDVHGNYDALSAFPESYDELWVLGDLVNYGPQPKEVIDLVRDKATAVVRGNHDQCIGYGDDPRCSPQFREMAEATRRFTEAVVTSEQRLYLCSFPLKLDIVRDRTLFLLCHATPSDPLYEYRTEASDKWKDDCARLPADIILIGHTHIPFVRYIDGRIIMNPGSLGQPKTGKPEACYGVWDNGRVHLRTYSYPVGKTAEKIRRMPVASFIQQKLISVLQAGGMPPQ